MASSSSKRRSPRQMASRKRSRYAEPETEDDLQSGDDFDSDFDLPRELAPSPPKKQRRVRVQHKPKTRSKSTAQEARGKTKRKRKSKVVEVGRPRRARRSSKQKEKSGQFVGPSDGVTPPWSTLPAEVLKDIFIFAGQPVTASNATWLIGAARTCRAFMEPALEALYYWPALWRPASLHQLLAVLQKRDGRLINYNTKVRRLDIDVRRLAYTAPGQPLFDLSSLITELPRLQHLEIVHPEDEPPYRAISLAAWQYPLSLFSGIITAQIRLTTWRWTYEMVKNRPSPYSFMVEMHQSKALAGLREVVLCGFQPPKQARLPTPIVEGETAEPDLLSALSVLTKVKDISLVSCDVVEKDWLSGLPAGLERLELSNCQYIYTEGLTTYLSIAGAKLKELVLNHNPAVDLSFLPSLKQSCPRLEVLEMDLHFYSRYFNTTQSDPEYDELLAADEVPTWPTTLRQLDLVHMQKWKAQGANNLFQSLVDSAADLPDLRYIVLHSHIDIPWRDRAKFRDDWIEKLQHVFKRRVKAPFAHNGSKLQYKLWKEKRNPVVKSAAVMQSITSGRSSPSASASSSTPAVDTIARRSKRVADASEALQLRLLSIEAESAQTPASDSDDEQSVVVPSDSGFIHGLCDVVDIRIDNQRPRENQFTEQDFLDSEASGDDDWDQHGDEEPDSYAW